MSETNEKGGDDDDYDDDEDGEDDNEDGAGASEEAEAGTSRTSTQYDLRDKLWMSNSHFRAPRAMAAAKRGEQAGATTLQKGNKEMFPEDRYLFPLLKQAWLGLGGTHKDFTWLGIHSPEDKDLIETTTKETDWTSNSAGRFEWESLGSKKPHAAEHEWEDHHLGL